MSENEVLDISDEQLKELINAKIGDLFENENIEVEVETSEHLSISERSQDSNWEKTVLDELRPDEQVDGNPRMAGLRRLTEKYVGPIYEVYTQLVQPPSQMNEIATATVSVTAGDYKACGTADAIKNTLDPPFNVHLSAIAETRALARALRQLLRINRVSSDEIAGIKKDLPEEDTDPSSQSITPNQITFIERLCSNTNRGYDINVRALFEHLLDDFDNVVSLTEADAQKAIHYLREDIQRKGKKVPQKLVGYDNGWKIN